MFRPTQSVAGRLPAAPRGLLILFVVAAVFGWTGCGRQRVPVYDYECVECRHAFKLPVRDFAADQKIVACPKCGKSSGERIMHYQCRSCWQPYDLKGLNISLANLRCPQCGSTAARDLDNPIPGDDLPVEGGKPFPGK